MQTAGRNLQWGPRRSGSRSQISTIIISKTSVFLHKFFRISTGNWRNPERIPPNCCHLMATIWRCDLESLLANPWRTRTAILYVMPPGGRGLGNLIQIWVRVCSQGFWLLTLGYSRHITKYIPFIRDQTFTSFITSIKPLAKLLHNRLEIKGAIYDFYHPWLWTLQTMARPVGGKRG